MLEVIGYILIGVLSLLSLVAVFLVVTALFPGVIDKCSQKIEFSYKRAFWLGFVNTLVTAIVAAVFALLAERMAQFFMLPVIVLLVFYVPSALFGLIALGRTIGGRLFPQASEIRQQAYGSGTMILACLFPLLGWYVLFPFLLVLGFGAFLLAVFSRPKIEEMLEEDF